MIGKEIFKHPFYLIKKILFDLMIISILKCKDIFIDEDAKVLM